MTKCVLLIMLFAITSLLSSAQGPMLWGMTDASIGLTGGTIINYQVNNNAVIVKDTFARVNGDGPLGAFMQADNDLLYGMTEYGGDSDQGVLFSYDMQTNSETVLHSFGGVSDGIYPVSALIQGNDGLLYGLTIRGGTLDSGSLFSFNIATGNETVLHNFAGNMDGLGPASALIQASNGLLYGSTPVGGAFHHGTIFSYNTLTDSLYILHSFGSDSDGISPGTLVQANDSLLFGTTYVGGTYHAGTIFSYNIYTGYYQKKHTFSNFTSSGMYPLSSLLLASNGLLYGVTDAGGSGEEGTIYTYDISNGAENIVYNFGNDGNQPLTPLMEASNGLLYGAEWGTGSTSDQAIIYSYNIASEVKTNLQTYDGVYASEIFGPFIEPTFSIGIAAITAGHQLQISPNPSTGQFIIQLPGNQSNYPTEVYNMLGQKVEQLTLSNAQNTLNLTNQPAGMYFVSVQTENRIVTGKVVVTK